MFVLPILLLVAVGSAHMRTVTAARATSSVPLRAAAAKGHPRAVRAASGRVGRRRALLASAPLLWQLHPRWRGTASGTSKRTGLKIEEIRDVVERDFVDRKCLVSGDLSPEIYSDVCVFTDPQMTCKGFEKFVRGTKALFYAPKSELELLEPVYIVGGRQIVAKFREVACFNIPFRPRTFFTGNLTLTLGENNLIERYVEQWDLSIPEILRTARI